LNANSAGDASVNELAAANKEIHVLRKRVQEAEDRADRAEGISRSLEYEHSRDTRGEFIHCVRDMFRSITSMLDITERVERCTILLDDRMRELIAALGVQGRAETLELEEALWQHREPMQLSFTALNGGRRDRLISSN
jgi:hypothetical protein